MIKRIKKSILDMLDRISRRLVNKLVLLFTTIIVLVVSALTVISYQMLQKESINNSIASTANNLLLVNKNMEDYLSGMQKLSLPQNRYDEITYAITHESSDYASRMYLENYLRELYYSRNDLVAIYMYVVDQHKYYSITREGFDLKVRAVSDWTMPESSWYTQALNSPQNRSYQSFVLSDDEAAYPVDTEQSFMAYHRVLRSIVTRKPQAVVSFYYNASGRDNIIKDIPFGEGQHLMVLGPDHTPFYVDDASFYREAVNAGLNDQLQNNANGKFTWTADNQKYLVVYDKGSQAGWSLVKPIPYKHIYEAATKTRNLSFLIGLAFLILSLILVSILSNAITRPLGKLSHQMRRFSSGNFDAEAEVIGRDEIAYLSRHFNLMVRRTNDLINERYKMKLVEKNAILKALEAEINPHFLYNALQAISTKALRHERYDIADMVDALAMTFRYCISGKDIVSAKDELNHIERYMALQQARFGSRLKVTYNWEDSLLGLEIPKLSIQTLAENAIKHAVEHVSSTVTIAIGAYVSESHVVISVKDDGPGFTQERLQQVQESFDRNWEDREGESIGLVNLNTRLKLLYGDAAELAIKTNKNGTEMQMLLPGGGTSYV